MKDPWQNAMLLVPKVLNVRHRNGFSFADQKNRVSDIDQAVIRNDHHLEEKVVQPITDSMNEERPDQGKEIKTAKRGKVRKGISPCCQNNQYQNKEADLAEEWN